jgi:hypothetical protein
MFVTLAITGLIDAEEFVRLISGRANPTANWLVAGSAELPDADGSTSARSVCASRGPFTRFHDRIKAEALLLKLLTNLQRMASLASVIAAGHAGSRRRTQCSGICLQQRLSAAPL